MIRSLSAHLFRLALVSAFVPALHAAEPSPAPLRNVHSHNDYMQARPLLEALDQGFCSVEADIHLVDGALLVAHSRREVKPGRTLQSMYLDPLRERVRQNHGRVYPGGPDVTLLIDLKTDAATTYPVLRLVLQGYADVLTEFRDDGIRTNAITVILSGNRPSESLPKEPVRLASLDGRPADLDRNPSPKVVPLISEDWSTLFHWRGQGAMSAEERAKLQSLIDRAHAQGRRIRFWGFPDTPAFWGLQREVGVDFINTDKLADLRAFLLKP